MWLTRGEILDLLAKFSLQNPDYRKALLRDPKGLIQAQFGIELPEHVRVTVLEETSDSLYVVLPSIPEEGDDLADEDLEALAGGACISDKEVQIIEPLHIEPEGQWSRGEEKTASSSDD